VYLAKNPKQEYIARRIQDFFQSLEDDWIKGKVDEIGQLHDELIPVLAKYPRVVVLSVVQIVQHEYVAEILAEVKANTPKTPLPIQAGTATVS
jgi:hypothetical protein